MSVCRSINLFLRPNEICKTFTILTSSAFAFNRHEMINKSEPFLSSGVVCGGLVTSLPPSSSGASLAEWLSGSQSQYCHLQPPGRSSVQRPAGCVSRSELPVSPAPPARPAWAGLTQTKASNVNSWESISNWRSAFHPGR